MNAVERIKLANDLDVFLSVFDSPELEKRRDARRRRDAEDAASEAKHRETLAQEAWRKRRCEMEAAHQMEVADTAASVVGALTMAMGLIGIAMIV